MSNPYESPKTEQPKAKRERPDSGGRSAKPGFIRTLISYGFLAAGAVTVVQGISKMISAAKTRGILEGIGLCLIGSVLAYVGSIVFEGRRLKQAE